MSGPGDRIRVTLVGPSLDILGGQAVQAQRLLERLQQVALISTSFIAVNPRLPGPLRMLQRVKYLRTIATSIAYLLTLVRQVPRTDIIHAFSASYWSFLLAPTPAMLIGRLMGKQVVLNYRSGEALDHLQRWRPIAIPLMKLAHVIAVPSGYLVEVFSQFGLSAQAIPNFVDTDAINYRHRERITPRFLSNRNFEDLYNVGMTLRAFELIQREFPDAAMTVVGQGSRATQLRAMAAELELRNVEFVGAVPPQEMPRYYQESDIYLNSPDVDNMPTSIIEAFAAGLPTVTTNAGGIPWLVRTEENGLLVECGDHVAMARAAIRLLREDGLADRLARQARADALGRYTWQAVEKQWVELYQSLAVMGKSGR